VKTVSSQRGHIVGSHRLPAGLLESLALYARLKYSIGLEEEAERDPCIMTKIVVTYIEDLGYDYSAIRLFNGSIPRECSNRP
jgi:hypothetical protein